MTEEQIFDEFLGTFGGNKNGDGKLTKDEWDDYYSHVSASIDDDEYFVEMIKHAWKLA